MLATLGFIITGLCFGIFAYTFNALVLPKTKLQLAHFGWAYYCLASALIIWGIAAAVGADNTLQASVVVGNALIVLGTLFMLEIWLGSKTIWFWVGAIVAAGLVLVRAVYFTPEAYMRGGILIFNTQLPVAAVIGLLFAGIWLPVNLRVAKQVTSAMGEPSMTQIYSAIYTAVTVAALIFLAARRTITVVLSFIAIGICFVMLIWSNLLVTKVKGNHAK